LSAKKVLDVPSSTPPSLFRLRLAPGLLARSRYETGLEVDS
jgi:hypothetical protein